MNRDSKGFEMAYSEPLLKDARPCPFCKGKALGMFPGPKSPVIPRETLRVCCAHCLCQGPIGDTAERAVAKWNGNFAPVRGKGLSPP